MENKRLVRASKNLCDLLGSEFVHKTNTTFIFKYNKKHGSAYDYCVRHLNDFTALERYAQRESEVKARYLEHIYHRYDNQMRLNL